MRVVSRVVWIAAFAAVTGAPLGRALVVTPPGSVGSAFAETEGIPTPFGTANDPVRPVPKAPTASGPGIVGATLVAFGPSEVEELGADGGEMAGAVVDLRVGAGSTTPLLLGSTIQAEGEGDKSGLYAVCVLTRDASLVVTRGDGVQLGAWNITVGGQAFSCSGGSAKLAMRVTGGGFRLVTAPGAEAGVRLLLLFRDKPSVLRRIVFPGATLELPVAEVDAAGGAPSAATPAPVPVAP